jgi:NADH dehydrogenase FAD-containing subunit
VGTHSHHQLLSPFLYLQINRKVNYLEATATAINPETKVVTCESVVCDGNSCDIEDFTVEYDRLVVTVGAQTNTFGIPGVREYCCFLKQVEDARRIRTAIVNCFERANLPSLTDEQRQNDLTIAVIGAGPTGIEFAAELRDFVEQDGPKYYPNLLKHVRIKVIEASSSVLAPFDKGLQEEAIRVMNRAVEIDDSEVRSMLPERFKLVELMLDQSVKEVTAKSIILNSGVEVRYGLAVWAAGNGPLPITLQLVDALGEEQAKEQAVARGRLAIDPWMRVAGGKGDILAYGDCTCITQGQLPATAQVAAQQGEYLAKILNKQYDMYPVKVEGVAPPPMKTEATTSSPSDTVANLATLSNGEYAKPFQFLDLGILAYTGGGQALAQVTAAPDTPPLKGTGKIGNTVWRSVYLSKQVSWRNRLLVLNDWAKRQIFGRDITRV